MEFKPNEFFLGLVDFIAILLPGALLTGILLAVDNFHAGWYSPGATDTPLFQLARDTQTVTVFWVGFVFTSFSLGYFLSSIASGLDVLFNRIREELFPYERQLFKRFVKQENKIEIGDNYEDPKIKIESGKEIMVLNHAGQLIKNEKTTFNFFCKMFLNNSIRRFFYFLFQLESMLRIDSSLAVVLSIKKNALGDANAVINAYKWSLMTLEAHYPVAAEQANRTMAASKFFRSLVVVFIVLDLLIFFEALPKSDSSLIIVGLLLLFSFREYVVQRQKSIASVYTGLITFYFSPTGFVKTKG